MGRLERGAWSKLRFEWKREVNCSSTVSRSAKQMASHLCDFCVNQKTGQFFHRNKTLAKGLGVGERSVQRYLNELVRLGWLRRVRVRGQRRTFQLTFPGGSTAREHDNTLPMNTSKSTPKHDKDVAPITNQVNNNKKPVLSKMFSVVKVSDQEQVCLDEWRAWISTHTELDGDKALLMLRKAGWYHLPTRYPLEDELSHTRYMEYFKAMVTVDA